MTRWSGKSVGCHSTTLALPSVVVGLSTGSNMTKEYDSRFTKTVNHLETLGYLYQKGLLKRERVEQLVRSLTEEMTDEQLDAYAEYEKERERQASEHVDELKKKLGELDAEKERRKRASTDR